MDPDRHLCSWKGTEVKLTVTEFLILQALATRPGMVKNRDQLMDAAYGESIFLDDRTIDSHIKRLRRKIRAHDNDFDNIETLIWHRLQISRGVTASEIDYVWHYLGANP